MVEIMELNGEKKRTFCMVSLDLELLLLILLLISTRHQFGAQISSSEKCKPRFSSTSQKSLTSSKFFFLFHLYIIKYFLMIHRCLFQGMSALIWHTLFLFYKNHVFSAQPGIEIEITTVN